MSYIDGFVAPVRDGDREAYREHAIKAAAIMMEHGALRVLDAWGTDVPDGKVTDFKRSVAAEAGEAVAFGWIEWASKAARDEAWPKLMADERLNALGMPFDGKRMIFGGFETLADTAAPAQAQAA